MFDANKACGRLRAARMPILSRHYPYRAPDCREVSDSDEAASVRPARLAHDRGRRHNGKVDLARAAWLTTVLACLVAASILLGEGYSGYSGVCLAVAVSAAINLR